MRFEEVIKSIWGTPQIPTYFAGYYDSASAGKESNLRAILFTLCIYETNYGRDKYDESGLETIRTYQNIADKGELTHNDDVKFIVFLHEHNH